MDAESVKVTAGLGGFLAFFLLAVALYFLMRNMNARMRRMAYREQLESEAAAAEPGGSAEPGETAHPGSVDGSDSVDGQDSAAVDDDSDPTRS